MRFHMNKWPTIEQLLAMNIEARREWLKSDEHWHDCASWNEGLPCCLELLLLPDERKKEEERSK